jgi:hypothetical protein
MVDIALLEQVLRLDAESRLELIRAIEGSLRDESVPAHVLEEIDRRLDQMGSAPSVDTVSSDEFIRRLRARHTG